MVGGQGSAFSARKEGGGGGGGAEENVFRCSDNRETSPETKSHAHTHTHTAHVSVSSCTVFNWKDLGGKHVPESGYHFTVKPPHLAFVSIANV